MPERMGTASGEAAAVGHVKTAVMSRLSTGFLPYHSRCAPRLRSVGQSTCQMWSNVYAGRRSYSQLGDVFQAAGLEKFQDVQSPRGLVV